MNETIVKKIIQKKKKKGNLEKEKKVEARKAEKRNKCHKA